ncbi:M81 family metallopeptidase [Rubrivivax albus]|uniref:Microcystinase C n=1 Tax=Rubrivivax albus TaxID=2499835 RepID=A0A3S2USX7_9BURK|nr:M81 family metallopeptidase [Rubrivivax albus]RVT54387.1 M81 family peptidase [Rubrivivax albus]
MKVFTATLATETNTFASMPTGMQAYRDFAYFPAGTHPREMSLFAGPLWAARQLAPQRGWQLAEGLVAAAQPAGPTTRSTYESLRDQLLADLKRAMPVDVVALGLHGAMVADGYPDCEGDLLSRVRALVGRDVVVGAELDPHCHLSPAMVECANVLVAFKEYPHTDIAERAFDLLHLCEAQARGRLRPVAAVVDCQMIVTMHTTREPARGFVERIKALEGRDGIVSISIVHGFPWGDVADMGTQMLVYADGDAAAAQRCARRLADQLIDMREQLRVVYPTIDEALDQALVSPAGPVVLADGADNPGGGAPSDSTFILRRVLERQIRPAAFGPLWDPIAVRVAFEAGVGSHLHLRIGGKMGPESGDPVDLRCTVMALRENLVMTGLGGSATPMGDCALIEGAGDSAGVQIVLVSGRNQAMHTDLFTQLGCKLQEQRLIVLKSMQHFHAAFAPLASRVIYVGAPGALSFDVARMPYQNVRRPKWPLSGAPD